MDGYVVIKRFDICNILNVDRIIFASDFYYSVVGGVLRYAVYSLYESLAKLLGIHSLLYEIIAEINLRKQIAFNRKRCHNDEI